ncbi:unnamed protein product [Periconia digitata]|uniref:Uncharacterized protein n=1 Tax=Periconia digitata TaxID=1303443 RepID=A0A9W4XYH8_9PLEO|nr:unnamed protein product [Periconia digitata]
MHYHRPSITIIALSRKQKPVKTRTASNPIQAVLNPTSLPSPKKITHESTFHNQTPVGTK